LPRGGSNSNTALDGISVTGQRAAQSPDYLSWLSALLSVGCYRSTFPRKGGHKTLPKTPLCSVSSINWPKRLTQFKVGNFGPIPGVGARANLGIKLAYRRDEASWDYYLEYMVPTEWNRGVPGAPYLLIRRMSPKYGGTPAYLGFIAVPAVVGQAAEKVEPSGNVRFRVELTNLEGPILKVSAKKL
jgi:hypothetical protein